MAQLFFVKRWTESSSVMCTRAYHPSRYEHSFSTLQLNIIKIVIFTSNCRSSSTPSSISLDVSEVDLLILCLTYKNLFGDKSQLFFLIVCKKTYVLCSYFLLQIASIATESTMELKKVFDYVQFSLVCSWRKAVSYEIMSRLWLCDLQLKNFQLHSVFRLEGSKV